tara:strand:+ start:209 stop:337 length:129 start_codon:yes stop_codon:yes gene_type:complete
MHDKLYEVIREIICHELDVITESDWFKELVEEEVKKALKEND